MAGTPVVLQLISIFCCVYGAYLRYGSAGLSDSPLNVSLSVGVRERVFCVQPVGTGPAPTSVEWYNPQGLIVSRSGGDEVNQHGAIGGRASILNFHSYQRSQGGRYECKVDLPGNKTEKLLAFIATGSATTTIATPPPTEAPSKTSSTPARPAEPPTTSEPSATTLSITTLPPPTQPPPSKVMRVRVTPSVKNTLPTLTVTWQALPSGALTYTVRYSTEQGEVNTPPEGALEVAGISDTSTILTALERGTTYYIWVVGVSEGGEGLYSDRKSGVTYDTLVPPLLSITFGSSWLYVKWNAQLATFRVLYRESGAPDYQVFVPTTSQLSHNISALQPNTLYNIVVEATHTVTQLKVNSSVTDAYTTRVNATVAAELPTNMSSTGAVVVAVVAVVGLLLLVGIAVVVVIAVVLRCKTKAMSNKPEMARDEEEGKKASPVIPPSQHGQADCKVVERESVEMTPLKVHNESQAIADCSSELCQLVPRSRFSEHVKAMHKTRDCGFEMEYQTIATIPEGVMDIAKANTSKNRYHNIYTYDASRVILSVPDSNGSDYINASFIDGYNQRSAYIASQGPNAATLSDFIQMIWDQKPQVVVMLTHFVEMGKTKCERYWCDEMNKPLELSSRGFTVTVTRKKDYADYEIRDMTIRYARDPSAKPLKLKHFFFTVWPDHGVPQHPYSLVKFIQHVRKTLLDSTTPLVVHCSAGVGRTGTFITVDAMMQRLKEKDDLDIYNFVTQMRTKRTFMVQNLDQYAFIHDALNDYLRCGDTAVVAHSLKLIITDLQKEDPQAKCSGFEQQFKLLQELSPVPCMVDINFAKKASIMKRNRYKDRFPYSMGYLHVAGKAGHEESHTAVDYYNASFVDGYSVPKAFIAAQSPMSHTKGDFWELVWQFRTPTIVLLINFMEGRQEACVSLWPATDNEIIDNYEVACNAFQPCGGYDVIKLSVTKLTSSSSSPLKITVFHFKKWPRDGNPEILSLLEMMGKMQKAHQKKNKPALVMCDDGMSRTGVFIAAMCEVERVKVEGEVDFFQTIKAMRKQRPHMVYNKEQYTLCFELLQAYLDSFDTYANFKDL